MATLCATWSQDGQECRACVGWMGCRLAIRGERMRYASFPGSKHFLHGGNCAVAVHFIWEPSPPESARGRNGGCMEEREKLPQYGKKKAQTLLLPLCFRPQVCLGPPLAG